jgi:hypothetical protein
MGVIFLGYFIFYPIFFFLRCLFDVALLAKDFGNRRLFDIFPVN